MNTKNVPSRRSLSELHRTLYPPGCWPFHTTGNLRTTDGGPLIRLKVNEQVYSGTMDPEKHIQLQPIEGQSAQASPAASVQRSSSGKKKKRGKKSNWGSSESLTNPQTDCLGVANILDRHRQRNTREGTLLCCVCVGVIWVCVHIFVFCSVHSPVASSRYTHCMLSWLGTLANQYLFYFYFRALRSVFHYNLLPESQCLIMYNIHTYIHTYCMCCIFICITHTNGSNNAVTF